MRLTLIMVSFVAASAFAAPSDPPPPPAPTGICARLFESLVRSPLDRALFILPRRYEARVARMSEQTRTQRRRWVVVRALDAAVFVIEPIRLTIFPDRRPSFPPDDWLREYYAEAEAFGRDVIDAAARAGVHLAPSRRSIAYTPYATLGGGGILFFFDEKQRATMRTPLGDLEISPTPVVIAADRDAIVRKLEDTHLLGIVKPGRDLERGRTVFAPNHNARLEEFPTPRLRDHDDPHFDTFEMPAVWNRVKPDARDATSVSALFDETSE